MDSSCGRGKRRRLDFVLIAISTVEFHFSRVILAYLTAAYSKDDTLYPRDIRVRALVDQRLHFDLGTLFPRIIDYYVIVHVYSLTFSLF